jgi:hypothetical protein
MFDDLPALLDCDVAGTKAAVPTTAIAITMKAITLDASALPAVIIWA